MSTKTLRKRIALATVAVLGTGVLSLVSAPASNAESTAIGSFTLSSNASGSIGLLGSTSTAGTPDQLTATVLSTGTLKVSGISGTYLTVSAGGVISSGTVNLSSSQTSDSTTAAAPSNALYIKPVGAVGSTFTVTGATSSTGSVVTVMTVTIAGASVAQVPSAAKSYVTWQSIVDNANGQSTNTLTGHGRTTDTPTASTNTTGKNLYLQIDLKDAYGNAVTTAGALTATVSSGANVSLGAASAAPAVGAYSTAVYASAPDDGTNGVAATISEATAGTGWSGTVTISYNGVVIATKSGTITGLASKVTITPNIVVHTNTTNVGAISYTAYDAAGNAVVVDPTTFGVATNTNTAAVSGISASNTTSNSTTASGNLPVIGGTTAGTSSVALKFTRSDGVVVTSNAVNISVGGAAASYKAKLDKSAYNQGDIATLTVSFLDSKGNAAASDSALYTVSGTSPVWNATFAVPMLTQIGTTGAFSVSTATVVSTYPTTASLLAAYAGVVPDVTGSITIKYSVGTASYAAGTYNLIADFPSVDAVAGSAQTVSFTAGSQGTSLNDVLKGIVALIASINKQIAALAKLVTKK